MRALQADRIAARQRARDSAARARRTAEEREAQLQTRRDAYARRTAGEREAELPGYIMSAKKISEFFESLTFRSLFQHRKASLRI